MKFKGFKKTIAALGLMGMAATHTAQAEDLTLCWASWDPANALQELSKEFEKESGHWWRC